MLKTFDILNYKFKVEVFFPSYILDALQVKLGLQSLIKRYQNSIKIEIKLKFILYYLES